MTPYIAFIDLLATKESANISAAGFSDAISTFGNVVTGCATLLKEPDRIRLFSDCAYIEVNSPVRLRTYLTAVRKQLFSQSLFFKCALAPGQLEIMDWKPEGSAKTKEHLRTIVQGTLFGKDTVSIYLSHEDFKGLGFTVQDALCGSGTHAAGEDMCVNSGYLTGSPPYRYAAFRDIRFGPDEIGSLYRKEGTKLIPVGPTDTHDSPENPDEDKTEGTMEEEGESVFSGHPTDEAFAFLFNFIRNALKAGSKSSAYGRYYVPTLVSITTSSDFSRLTRDDDTWDNFPLIFHFLLKSKLGREVARLPGAELVFLALFQQIHATATSLTPADEREVVRLISRTPRLLSRDTRAVPPQILSAASRERLHDHLAHLRMGIK